MIGIIGAGGHAKVVAEILLAVFPQAKLTFFSSNPDYCDPFYTTFDHFNDQRENLRLQHNTVKQWHVAIGNMRVRKIKTAVLEQLQYKLIQAIHPTAIISSSSNIGTGSSVMAGAIINSAAIIEKACIINTGAIIEHDCHIGEFTNIGPGSRLAGGVTVGENSELGAGTIIIPNVTIGKNCTIGAGSVVIRDIPDGSRAVGVPAKCLD